MKKKILTMFLVLLASASVCACGKKNEPAEEPAEESSEVSESASAAPESSEPESEKEDEEPPEDIPEGMYHSELTNEFIDESLKDQRPVAIMVDNESIALPHYGLTQADVIYEMMNSTMNGRITRFMCLVKDWDKIERFGSIRSVRTTNILLAAEWNAIICHDGGPFYINQYMQEPYAENLSGSFARINNGKAREYTEYITTGEIEKRITNSKYSRTYNEYYEDGYHFKFSRMDTPVDLTKDKTCKDVSLVDLPFPHNKSQLDYDADKKLYYYSEYGQKHVDPQNDNAQLCFKNVLVLKCPFLQLDDHGYLTFFIINMEGGDGYYISDGKAIEIKWVKESATAHTRYYDTNGEEITINTGKTYIGIVPDDDWDDLVLQ